MDNKNKWTKRYKKIDDDTNENKKKTFELINHTPHSLTRSLLYITNLIKKKLNDPSNYLNIV